MQFLDGSKFISECIKNGYFYGTLTEGIKEIKGYLCDEIFLTENKNLYCEEDEIR